MKSTCFKLAGVTAALFLAGAAAQAAEQEELRQTVTVNDPLPTAEAIESALFPDEIQKKKKECADLVAAGFKCMSVIPKATLSTNQVTFERGSAKITQGSQQYLRQVGQVLKKRHDALNGLVIEGHTDATGSSGVNKKLSEARAESVRQFLSAEFGIDKIETRGVGSARLKDSADPANKINRRIEFVSQ